MIFKFSAAVSSGPAGLEPDVRGLGRRLFVLGTRGRQGRCRQSAPERSRGGEGAGSGSLALAPVAMSEMDRGVNACGPALRVTPAPFNAT